MIQAMQILQLPALDLEERIEQELVENPFLEEVEASPENKDAEHEDERGQEEPSKGLESMLEEIERAERDFGDGPRVRAGDGEDGDRKLEAMQNTPDAPKNLAEALQVRKLLLVPFREHAPFLVVAHTGIHQQCALWSAHDKTVKRHPQQPLFDVREARVPGRARVPEILPAHAF